jgi:hypothetical protein
LRFDQPGEYRVEVLHDLDGAATSGYRLPSPTNVADSSGTHSWWANGLQLPGITGGLGEVVDWARAAVANSSGYSTQVRFMYDLVVRNSGVSFLPYITYPATISLAAGLGYTTRALVVRRRDPDMLVYRSLAEPHPNHVSDVAATLRGKREEARAKRGSILEKEQAPPAKTESHDDF